MEDLIDLLHTGENTLVVANGEVCAFKGRGIADLYRLLQNDPGFLSGASVADKIVGKGAAALMVLGGISELYTDVISEPAMTLLKGSPIKVSYRAIVSHIKNRQGTGLCPVEKLCENCMTAEECLPLIRNFIENNK